MRRIVAIFPMIIALMLGGVRATHADPGLFDNERWDSILANVRSRAAANKVSDDTINAALKNPVFIPSVVKNDKNQSEFKLSLDEYLARTVNPVRIARGKKMKNTYPTAITKHPANMKT